MAPASVLHTRTPGKAASPGRYERGRFFSVSYSGSTSTVAGTIPSPTATPSTFPAVACSLATTASPIAPYLGLSVGLVRTPTSSPSLVTAAPNSGS